MQAEGLKARYENDVAFALLLRHIPALAFVPPAQVLNAYTVLAQLMPNEMLPILLRELISDGQSELNAGHHCMRLTFGMLMDKL